MNREEFIEQYARAVVSNWNEKSKLSDPYYRPLGLTSNVALLARCNAEALWDLSEQLCGDR